MYKIDTEIVCSSKLDNETLILNLDTGFYYTLDQVGAFIWDRLLEHQGKAQILAAVVTEYRVTQEEAENDFTELVISFEREGLIQDVQEGYHAEGKRK